MNIFVYHPKIPLALHNLFLKSYTFSPSKVNKRPEACVELAKPTAPRAGKLSSTTAVEMNITFVLQNEFKFC